MILRARLVPLWLLLLTTTALAEEEEPDFPPGFELTRYEVTLAGGYIAETDFDSGEGTVSTTRLLGELGATHFLSRREVLGLSVKWQLSHFDFEDAVGLAPGTSDPFNQVRLLRFSGFYRRQESEEVSWILGPAVETAGERGGLEASPMFALAVDLGF